MQAWRKQLIIDPIPELLAAEDEALRYFVRRDLQGESVKPVTSLWELPEAAKIVDKQQADGSWKYPGKKITPSENYSLLETFRKLGILVGKYGFRREHPAIQATAEYVFTCQTGEGDIRGILSNQYMPYYHALISELLIRAGYGDDPRILKGLEWLLWMRQEDGGWLIPVQTVPFSEMRDGKIWTADPIPPDRTLPSSHVATGLVLRAFVYHPRYREREAVRTPARFLKSRFFKPDGYSSRQAPHYWLKFQYPFWWPNLLTALDSLALMGFTYEDRDIQRGLKWFLKNQEEDGLWETGYGKAKDSDLRSWVGLAVCRVLKRFIP